MRSKLKRILKNLFFICLGYGMYCNTHAIDDVHLQPWFDLSNSRNNAWTISGLLHNEQDEYYGFLMILERQEQVLHVFASLYDLNEKKLIWHQDDTQYLELDTPCSQSSGGFYWHFSPINQSFILAYQDKKTKKQLFNLKMDFMQPIVVTPKMSLTPTLKVKQFWSGSINGHIHTPDEQFVTSASVWVQIFGRMKRIIKHTPSPKYFVNFKMEVLCLLFRLQKKMVYMQPLLVFMIKTVKDKPFLSL